MPLQVNDITVEEKLADALVKWLKQEPIVAALGQPYTQFEDAKIKLPGLFIKTVKNEEAIENSGIFDCSAEIELRWLVKATSEEKAQELWNAIDERICAYPFSVLADCLSDMRDDFIVHSVGMGESEPTTRENERHKAMTLDFSCATI
jgi:hypothetical protein